MRAIIWIVFFSFMNVTAATYPPPVMTSDTSSFGFEIQRTMTLLSSSTPTHRSTVKILFYGQSITKQTWTLDVGRYLVNKYPNTNIIIKNLAVGGFAADLLHRIVEHDIDGFYPDLVILYDYINRDSAESDYDSIVKCILSKTTAEVMIQDNHYTGANTWDDSCMHYLESFCPIYKAEYVKQRTPWINYLTVNTLQPGALLSDAIHLNTWGNFLMAELVKPYFRYRPAAPKTDWEDVCSTFVVTPAMFTNGSLSLAVNGNRVDIIAESPNPGAAPVTVLVDNKKPSSFPGCYNITRPNGFLGADWFNDSANTSGRDWPWDIGAFLTVSSRAALPRIEDWTLTITKVNSADYGNVDFSIQGSITGADGTGNSLRDFVSNSQRVVISAADWYLRQANSVLRTTFPAGYTIKWSVVPMFVDTFRATQFTDTTIEHLTTVAQGLPNTNHTLTLTAIGNGPVPIKAIRVYRPMLGRSVNQVFHKTNRMGLGNRRIVSTSLFDLHGRLIEKITGDKYLEKMIHAKNGRIANGTYLLVKQYKIGKEYVRTYIDY
jgi:hypothetical protein